MHCDGQSSLLLAQNSIYHTRMKHIDIRYHQIRELMEEGEVELVNVHTKCWSFMVSCMYDFAKKIRSGI